MKPSELYAMEPESEAKGIEGIKGCSYNHVPECFGDFDSLMYSEGFCERITQKEIKYFNFDGRRYWRLATVWFDGKPVMVTQNAGREGDDHARRFITDAEAYKDMVQYIDHECVKQNLVNIESHDPDADIDGLETFYGNTLRGYFERY